MKGSTPSISFSSGIFEMPETVIKLIPSGGMNLRHLLIECREDAELNRRETDRRRDRKENRNRED